MAVASRDPVVAAVAVEDLRAVDPAVSVCPVVAGLAGARGAEISIYSDSSHGIAVGYAAHTGVGPIVIDQARAARK